MTAILGAAAAHANSDKPVHVSIGATARAPIGYVEFCNEMPKECIASASEPRDVVLTAKVWKDLVRVNKWVNDLITPVTDMDHWGVVEKWSYPDDGKGDCEDYVLLKRRMLMQAGWPREALLITVVRDKKGDGHAVRHQDRQGRLRPRDPGGAGPALVGYRLPLRQASVAEQPEQLGFARRHAARIRHRHLVALKTGIRVPVTSPPSPSPDRAPRAAGVPQRRPQPFFGTRKTNKYSGFRNVP